jgi:hypothetical protein
LKKKNYFFVVDFQQKKKKKKKMVGPRFLAIANSAYLAISCAVLHKQSSDDFYRMATLEPHLKRLNERKIQRAEWRGGAANQAALECVAAASVSGLWSGYRVEREFRKSAAAGLGGVGSEASRLLRRDVMMRGGARGAVGSMLLLALFYMDAAWTRAYVYTPVVEEDRPFDAWISFGLCSTAFVVAQLAITFKSFAPYTWFPTLAVFLCSSAV